MIAYIDSSVLIRVVLGQPAQLPEWKKITAGVASGLIEVECLRTLDRLQLSGHLSAQVSAVRREAVYRVIEALQLVELTSAVLHRAAQPMPVPLGTLDAIHLATAEMWRESRSRDLVMATHDHALGLAARAVGIQTIGV